MQLMFAVRGEFSMFNLCEYNVVQSTTLKYIFFKRSPFLAVSASDDRTSRLWDARVRGEVGKFEDEYQITAVAYANDGNAVYTGGIDNCITAWDVRQMRKSMTMKGHSGRYSLYLFFYSFEFFPSVSLVS